MAFNKIKETIAAFSKSIQSKNAKCPKCHSPLDFFAIIPDECKIKMRLENETTVISAKTLGEMIVRAEKLFVQIAKDMGSKVHVVITEIDKKDNMVEVEFAVLKVKSPKLNRPTND